MRGFAFSKSFTVCISVQYIGGDGSSIATLMKCYLWFGSLDEFYKQKVPYNGTYAAFAETVSWHQIVLFRSNVAAFCRKIFCLEIDNSC